MEVLAWRAPQQLAFLALLIKQCMARCMATLNLANGNSCVEKVPLM